MRHASSGAASLLSQKVTCSVINAGDGQHEHPTQALLDALSMRRAFGRIGGLTVAICGDVLHSRVARSNVMLLTMLGANVRLVGPPTLMPSNAERWGVELAHYLGGQVQVYERDAAGRATRLDLVAAKQLRSAGGARRQSDEHRQGRAGAPPVP